MECGEAAWLLKNKKLNQANMAIKQKIIPVNS
jgi:hypothetical protein